MKKQRRTGGFFPLPRHAIPLLLALPLSAAGCWAFSLCGTYALLMLPLGALTLLPGIRAVLRSRSASMEAREFLRFIEFLSSRVSAGYPIESALSDAPRFIRQDLRAQSPLLRSLERASRSLRSGLALNGVLQQLGSELSSPRSRRFCRILPEIVRQGARTELFLQICRDQYQKEQETLEELRTEQSSVSGECLIMSVMPFFMAAVGKTIPAFRESFQGAGRLSSFIFCALAFLLLTLCLCLSVFRIKERQAADGRFLPRHIHPQARRLSQDLLNLYPGDLAYRLRSQLQRLFPGDSLVWEKYCQVKIIAAAATVIPLLAACAASRRIWPLLFMFLPLLLADLKLLQSGREESEAERQQYPAFLNLMAILLSAGLSPERSLRLSLRVLTETERASFPKKKKTLSVLGRDLKQASRRLRSGATASQVLSFLGQKQRQSELAQVLHMMARYEQEGGLEQLSLIRMQALQSREIYRLSMRRRLSRRGMYYLFPMGLDLLLVLAVTSWPALSSLGGAF